jgi:hypothetical protein
LRVEACRALELDSTGDTCSLTYPYQG